MTLTIYIISMTFEQMASGYSLEKIRRSNVILFTFYLLNIYSNVHSFLPVIYIHLQQIQHQIDSWSG
jgi:hypothetical protein